ncbi:hypothetical protein F0562_029597 [Nyssa sinensis]|uniref:Uncharacterized protein n=1 Tax=Nyssa sinensis TaxID=561372 RepID=A0A5J5B5V6_9ASTE|nr:hypothetical protein F0562_029597 [Nyssa sinensis]
MATTPTLGTATGAAAMDSGHHTSSTQFFILATFVPASIGKIFLGFILFCEYVKASLKVLLEKEKVKGKKSPVSPAKLGLTEQGLLEESRCNDNQMLHALQSGLQRVFGFGEKLDA